MVLTFKAICVQAPAHFQDYFYSFGPQRTMHAADQHLLVVPGLKAVCLASAIARASSTSAPAWWNMLLLEIRALQDLLQFPGPIKWNCSARTLAEVTDVQFHPGLRCWQHQPLVAAIAFLRLHLWRFSIWVFHMGNYDPPSVVLSHTILICLTLYTILATRFLG